MVVYQRILLIAQNTTIVGKSQLDTFYIFKLELRSKKTYMNTKHRYILFCLFIFLLYLPSFAGKSSFQDPFLFSERTAVIDKLNRIKEDERLKQTLMAFINELEIKGSKKDLYTAYKVGSVMLFQRGYFDLASELIDKGVELTKKFNVSGIEKSQLYFYLSKRQKQIGENNKAIVSLNQSIDYLYEYAQKENITDLLIEQGLLSIDIKNYNGAIKLFSSIVELSKEKKDTVNIAKAYYYKGVAAEKRGDYDNAMESLVHAQQEYSKINDSNGICATIISTANIFYTLKDYNQALTLYFKALDNCQDSDIIDDCYLNIGMIYIYKSQMEEALNYLNEYESINNDQRDTIGIIRAKIALGKYYSETENLSRSIITLHDAINLLERYPDVSEEGNLLLVLSKVYVKTKDFSQAKAYAQKALIIASTLDEKELKANCYNVFSDLYEMQGDYRSAYYYKGKYENIKDSLLNNQTILALRELAGIKGNTKDKKVIKELEQENISLNNYWLKEKNKGYLLLITSILLLFFTIILFTLFRAKAKVEKKLKQKNTELEKLNATKDKFFSIIAHDLKSPFNSLMGFSEMLSLHAESKSYSEIMEYSGIIHNSTRKLYSLVDTLLQWSRTQLGTTEYKPQRLEIGIVSSNIVSILKINAEEKDIVISVDIDNTLIGWADKDLYSAVLRNLISNAIKFSRVGSVITVSAKTRKQFIEVAVSDTGVGITKENLAKIFKIDKNISTKGTFNEKGTGLGLVLCKEFVEINRGTIWAESKLEKGSTFKFTVPLVK